MIHKLKHTFLGTSLLALLAACGGGDTDQSAQANTHEREANGSVHSMPTGPFSQAEMQMNERMMAATGANASETWTRKMIEHHRGAVAMSQVLVDQGGEPRFVEMARMTIETQQRGIGELERMLAGGVDGGAGEANPFGQVEQGMHRQMMASGGGNISETWARKMIAHHQGAVEMSETLIRQGGDPEVVAMARRTAEDQRREVAHLEAMLRGEATPSAGATPTRPRGVSEPTQRDRAPTGGERVVTPSARPAETRAPRDPAAPATAPRQSPSPTPTPTCAPEHRALGHC